MSPEQVEATLADERRQIAQGIEADPVGTYDRLTGGNWGPGLAKWVPENMRPGVVRYVLLGVRPGSFLCAIIEGDYFEACRRADDINRAALWHYAMFFHNYAPGGCFGSRDHLVGWLRDGGMMGERAREVEPC
jgi:hypothetical protein